MNEIKTGCFPELRDSRNLPEFLEISRFGLRRGPPPHEYGLRLAANDKRLQWRKNPYICDVFEGGPNHCLFSP